MLQLDRQVPAWHGREAASARGMTGSRQWDKTETTMGTFVWWFVREAEGQIRPLSVRKADEFLDGKLVLPTADNIVRLVLVAGPTEDRRALAVRTLELTKHAVDARGIHDRWPSMVQAAEHMSALDLLSGDPRDRGDNVIRGERKFQMARYRARRSGRLQPPTGRHSRRPSTRRPSTG